MPPKKKNRSEGSEAPAATATTTNRRRAASAPSSATTAVVAPKGGKKKTAATPTVPAHLDVVLKLPPGDPQELSDSDAVNPLRWKLLDFVVEGKLKEYLAWWSTTPQATLTFAKHFMVHLFDDHVHRPKPFPVPLDAFAAPLFAAGVPLKPDDMPSWCYKSHTLRHRSALISLLYRLGGPIDADNVCLTGNVLHVASFSNEPEFVIDLVKRHPELLESRDDRGRTVLLVNAEHANLVLTRKLLALGAKADAVDAEGNTALHLTAKSHWKIQQWKSAAGIAALVVAQAPQLLTVRNSHGELPSLKNLASHGFVVPPGLPE